MAIWVTGFLMARQLNFPKKRGRVAKKMHFIESILGTLLRRKFPHMKRSLVDLPACVSGVSGGEFGFGSVGLEGWGFHRKGLKTYLFQPIPRPSISH